MLIQSQDKNFVVNTNTLVSLYRDGCNIRCIIDYDSGSFGYTMRTCTNEEIAKNVLDSILEAVANGVKVIRLCEKTDEIYTK